MQDNTALLIIDVQNGFINEHTEHLPALIEKDQAKYSLVWVAKLEYTDDSPLLTIRDYDGFSKSGELAKLAFKSRDDAKVVAKKGYSAATPELLRELKQHNITKVDLMGIDTDQCVLATAFGLFEASIRPRIIIDRCASTAGAKAHQAGIDVLTRALGEQNVLYSEDRSALAMANVM